MKNKLYIINSKIVQSTDANISLDDYGFMRGYAVFETMKFKDRRVLSLSYHMDRLFRSLKIINIILDGDKKEKVISNINKIIEINSLVDGSIKLIITKGTIEDNISNKVSPNIYITIAELPLIPKSPVKVSFFNESKYPILRFNPAIKSINYLGNMMAIADANKDGAFEVVFYNNDNIITECAMRNIFFIKKNFLITPALNLGILPGTTRTIISKLAQDVNLHYSEEDVTLSKINDMDEAFICSTLVGILPCYWDGWTSDFILTKRLQFLLEESLKK